eukprot:TRINITY_DN9604_c0_g2_i1.p1 TRINITY_DN9604_c0_g2~~TRINITY_DN9604_c0_g2_i1.p1  ORF type:complete len:304 (+),score=51.63 TRINITY_DN9604_c0_g2_i1:56-967(+)
MLNCLLRWLRNVVFKAPAMADRLDLKALDAALHQVENSSPKILSTPDLQGVVEYIQQNNCRNIITMAGAGISTSAGIPDFRSPGTGLYDNLQQYNLPYPEAVFTMSYFHAQPEPFFLLAKELYPGNFDPTPCHHFIKLLQDQGRLLRHYTQNIDTLERVAGVDGDKLVEAHGSFASARCVGLGCRKEHSADWVKTHVMQGTVPKCDACQQLVKPDIVFFGENLPARFGQLIGPDFKQCDLLIVLGTSLTVNPFASYVMDEPGWLDDRFRQVERGEGGTKGWGILHVNAHWLRTSCKQTNRCLF